MVGTAINLARVHVREETHIVEPTTAFSDTRDPFWDLILVVMGITL